MKNEKGYKGYERRDAGYLITFENENEVKDLLNKKSNHVLFAEILAEKELKMPFFVDFDSLNDACKGKLKPRLFSPSVLENLDLISLKKIILRTYHLYQFELSEIQRMQKRNQEKYLIRRKYFELYLMVGNISIDGFKRERYVLKVKDFHGDIVRAQRQLHEEELKMDGGLRGTHTKQQSFVDNLGKIT